MFDNSKVQRITALLERLTEEYDEVYILPEETFSENELALFRRLNIPIRAIVHDLVTDKEIFGIPILKTAEAAENFNERTILIVITKKSLPLIQTTFDFKVKGGTWAIPALVMTNNEVKAIYDSMILKRIIQLYKDDGIKEDFFCYLDLFAERLTRGFTTFLDIKFQDIKYQLRDSRHYFKPQYTPPPLSYC